jgi:NTP pyrophosphatase (non-canonical NTP hydrolase)
MDFKTYQERAGTTAMYPSRGKSLCYPALGLAGEAGEVAEKVKKLVRGDGDLYAQPDEALRQALAGELGDLLWYIAALCFELDLKMSDVAQANLEKLASRKKRGVIHGDGDSR